MQIYDRIIIGAGMYGLYAANKSLEKGYKTLVLDIDAVPFSRGSYINQARLHNGYHYPRSFSTAYKSAQYFDRFYNDFSDCINDEFKKIYAVASDYSWTNGEQFQNFSNNLGVLCEKIPKEKYFNKNSIDTAFLTKEYSFDAMLLKKKLYSKSIKLSCDFKFNKKIIKIEKCHDKTFKIITSDHDVLISPYILNSTYAGTNQIHTFMNYEQFNIKYELCEVILCEVSENIKHIGLTVMDGPFFSVMPFGKTGYHSITTVSRTPHVTCYDRLPVFECQKFREECTSIYTCNCNSCDYKPKSAFIDMLQTAKKYLRDDINIRYKESLFTLKPIIKASEIDDSRPTIIRQFSENPDFYTVFSGKINTMYDLDVIL